MLVFSRKKNDSIMIGDDIRRFFERRREEVRLAVTSSG